MKISRDEIIWAAFVVTLWLCCAVIYVYDRGK